MFHSTITILTTAAVALHAMLGCCMHHSHSCCDAQGISAVAELHETDGSCCHAHAHERGGDENSIDGVRGGDDTPRGVDHEHQHDCEHSECSFTSVHRDSDGSLTLTFAKWCQTLCGPIHRDAFAHLIVPRFSNDSLPTPSASAHCACAISQVWRL